MRLQDFRGRVGEWAAETHPDEFLASLRCWVGRGEIDEDAIASATAFAILVNGPGGSLIERWAAQAGRLPRAERLLVEQRSRCRFAIVRVVAVERGRSLDLHDVLHDSVFRVHEVSGTYGIDPGDWLTAFTFAESNRYSFEGSALQIVEPARIDAVHAALRAYAAMGVTAREATASQSRAIARAVVDAVHLALRPPRVVNADGHDLLLVTSTLGLTWTQVVAVLSTWPDAERDADAFLVVGPEPVPYLGGLATRATVALSEGTVTVWTNSRQRHDAFVQRWEKSTGKRLPIVEESVETVPSDPGGREMTIDSARVARTEGSDPEDVERVLVEGHDADWCDTAIPALDDQTPRAAASTGRTAELWALLPDGERGERLAHELSLRAPGSQRRSVP